MALEKQTFPDENNDQIAYIKGEISAIPGITVFFTHGNYILFDAKDTGKKDDDIVAYVQEKSIILRPQNYSVLDSLK